MQRSVFTDASASLKLGCFVSGGFISSKICVERDGFVYGVVGFPFLDSGVLRSASYGLCDSRLVRFAGLSGRVADFGARGGFRLLNFGKAVGVLDFEGLFFRNLSPTP